MACWRCAHRGAPAVVQIGHLPIEDQPRAKALLPPRREHEGQWDGVDHTDLQANPTVRLWCGHTGANAVELDDGTVVCLRCEEGAGARS